MHKNRLRRRLLQSPTQRAILACDSLERLERSLAQRPPLRTGDRNRSLPPDSPTDLDSALLSVSNLQRASATPETFQDTHVHPLRTHSIPHSFEQNHCWVSTPNHWSTKQLQPKQPSRTRFGEISPSCRRPKLLSGTLHMKVTPANPITHTFIPADS
jgi:hypothetical protein